MNYSEIILDPRGNTYVGAAAQPFATGKLKLPAVFSLDSSTELFHVFEVMDNGDVIQRAAVSSRATAQTYMAENRVCVYRSAPDPKDTTSPLSVRKCGRQVLLTFAEENHAATASSSLKKLYNFIADARGDSNEDMEADKRRLDYCDTMIDLEPDYYVLRFPVAESCSIRQAIDLAMNPTPCPVT